jgi:hypothetical protein
MKNFIKVCFVLIAILFANYSQAQSVEEVCRIVYKYDGAGNRIGRAYECFTPRDPSLPPVGYIPDEQVVVYPNPTGGIVNGVFNETTTEMLFVSVYSVGGIRVHYESFQPQISFFTINLSHLIPGSYVLYMEWGSRSFNEVLLKY